MSLESKTVCKMALVNHKTPGTYLTSHLIYTEQCDQRKVNLKKAYFSTTLVCATRVHTYTYTSTHTCANSHTHKFTQSHSHSHILTYTDTHSQYFSDLSLLPIPSMHKLTIFYLPNRAKPIRCLLSVFCLPSHLIPLRGRNRSSESLSVPNSPGDLDAKAQRLASHPALPA